MTYPCKMLSFSLCNLPFTFAVCISCAPAHTVNSAAANKPQRLLTTASVLFQEFPAREKREGRRTRGTRLQLQVIQHCSRPQIKTFYERNICVKNRRSEI